MPDAACGAVHPFGVTPVLVLRSQCAAWAIHSLPSKFTL